MEKARKDRLDRLNGRETRGASDTPLENTSGLLVDWLTFHLPAEAVPDFEVCYPWDVVALDKGLYGYTHSGVILDVGRVAWSPLDPERGRWYSLPAKALAYIEDVPKLVGAIVDLGGSVSRLDIAKDDYDGVLDLDRIQAALADPDHFTSRWKSHTVIQKTYHSNGQRTGKTIYLGSRKSEMFARIYDKAAEQADRGAEAQDLPDKWVRFEIEAKHKKADKLARLVLAEDWEQLTGVIGSYLSFRKPTDDSNKSRWPVADWWAEFLGTVERVSGFFSSEVKRTLDDVVGWLKRSVGPSLAVLLAARGGDLSDVLAIAKDGRQRWGKKHRAILAAAA